MPRKPALTSLTVAYFTDDLDTNHQTATLIAGAEQRMRQARRGYPGSGMASNGSSGDNSSPVERALGLAGQPNDTDTGIRLTPDEGEAALHELRRLVRSHHDISEALFRHCTKWSPKAADDRAKQATKDANGVMCAHCTRWMSGLGLEELHVRTDVGGLLEEPLALGRWCYDFARRERRLPTETECRRRDKGMRIRVRVPA